MQSVLGISVYLQDMTQAYIKEASEKGVSYIFTSLHIPEEDLSTATETIKELLRYAKKYQMSLVPDVSPATFEKLGLAVGDFAALKALGITALRLDYGYDDVVTVKRLQSDFTIMLNASTLNEAFIVAAESEGVVLSKLIGVHNFYPKSETGLSLARVKESNQLYLKYGIPVIAFVPGDKLKRFPLYEGLPTVESHRSLHPYVAALELFFETACSGVMIGDSQANTSTLTYLADFFTEKTISIPVVLNPDYHYLFETLQYSRADISEYLVRLTVPRQAGIAPQNNGVRNKGDIIIQNKLAGRYSGEVQLCKETLSFSATGNKIGFIHPDFVGLTKFITAAYALRFVPAMDVYE